MYEVVLSRMKSVEQKMNVAWIKWLGISRILTDVALQAHPSILRLLLRSIIEEYKCAMIRLDMMMRDSSGSTIARDTSRLRSGCK